MAFGSFFPQNEKAVKKYGSKYGTASKYMVYNGPYIMSGWSGSNLSWKLKKNPYYWDKKNVKLDAVNYSVQKTPSTAYNLYQSNKLDAVALDAEQSKQLKSVKGYALYHVGLPSTSNSTRLRTSTCKTPTSVRLFPWLLTGKA